MSSLHETRARGSSTGYLDSTGAAGGESWPLPDGVATLDKLVAVVVALGIGLHYTLPYGFSLGLVLALITIPLWQRTALSDLRFRVIGVLAVLAVASGYLLGFGSSRSIAGVASQSIEMLAIPFCVGALLWAGALLTPARMAFAFAAGVVIGIVFADNTQGNPWRFVFSIPITLFLLAVAARRPRLAPQMVILGVLAVVGALSDSRSNTGILLLVALVMVMQVFVGNADTTRRAKGVGLLVVLGVVAYALYELLMYAILDGVFGSATQQRTQDQIDRSGSLILGGRPELAATFALLWLHPFGMGTGVNASRSDIGAARQAMWDIGYDPFNGYVNRYMFGSGIEVHSTLGDVWLWYGLFGAALLLCLAWVVLSALANSLARGTATALFLYLAVRFLWDLAVSPFTSASGLLPLTIALALMTPRLFMIRPVKWRSRE